MATTDRKQGRLAGIAGLPFQNRVYVAAAGALIYALFCRPSMPPLGREAGTHVFRDLDENPGDETFP